MPSLDALRAFDVVARRLSFTEAAQDLCVTQGAVSQRIKTLEGEIGTALFHRRKTGLALTPAGERLSGGVRAAIERIQAALDAVEPDPAGGSLKVSVLPSFFCWLMPRLHRFAARHPGIRVELLAQGEVVDLRAGEIDMAIRFGPGRYPGVQSEQLMGDRMVPVCAPGLAAGLASEPRMLARLPILRDSMAERDDSGTDWASWLASTGMPQHGLEPGQHFGQAGLTIEAAARGLGVALARGSLIGEHVAAGRLVALAMPAIPTEWSYHLVWCDDAVGASAPLRAWLRAEAAAGD